MRTITSPARLAVAWFVGFLVFAGSVLALISYFRSHLPHRISTDEVRRQLFEEQVIFAGALLLANELDERDLDANDHDLAFALSLLCYRHRTQLANLKFAANRDAKAEFDPTFQELQNGFADLNEALRPIVMIAHEK